MPRVLRRPSARVAVVALISCTLALIDRTTVTACTAFCAVGSGRVLVGNNEDWREPRTKLWFVPASEGSFGRMYVGFDDLWPQGGMNERGLWFDGFTAPPMAEAAGADDLPTYPGNIVDAAMAQCGTVEEVVELFSRYDRSFLVEAIYMFADASGDAVSIERNTMVRKRRGHFVQTNFHQSRPESGGGHGRYATAASMLEEAGERISPELFRRILAATHQKGSAPTLYSNVYDLTAKTMTLYYFHDFSRSVRFDLAEELEKGRRVLDIPALFPVNPEAERFAARQQGPRGLTAPMAAAILVGAPILLLALAAYTWITGGRPVRIAIGVLAGALVAGILGGAAALHRRPESSAAWLEFSIGPASGDSASISTHTIRADGITAKMALAVAYQVPTVRIVGPRWLDDTRYALRAAVGVEQADSFRPLLRQELENRLGLETHVERRPFDVFVLTAPEAPRLEAGREKNPSIWIGVREATLRDASLERLASGIQGVVGRPVIDETGITGVYHFEFQWGEDPIDSITAALRDRYGLHLSAATRTLDALIVDGVHRDPSMLLLGHVGRATRSAPPEIRRQIAGLLTIR
jgi:uncharacterized protein (TIGR03435 family)